MVDEIYRAIRSYVDSRMTRLAGKVVWRLRRLPPSWIDGDDASLRSVWDELRIYMEKGPIEPLESFWDETLFGYCWGIANALGEDERRILSFTTDAYFDSGDDDPVLTSDVNSTAFQILRKVKQMALDAPEVEMPRRRRRARSRR